MEYDPGFTANDYYNFFTNEKIVKRAWLEALYELYQMPGHLGTCKQLGERYGHKPTHYIGCLSSIAWRIHKKARGPYYYDGKKAQFWPILFQGKDTNDKSEGTYYWKIREPVNRAIERLIKEGCFDEKEYEMVQFDHNIILYGPPGTGKTYNSITYAVAICDEKSVDEEQNEPYEEILKRYKALKEDGRIAFTTFHQSYGYEEFIEGIKPKLNTESGSIGYIIEDGVFKKFCTQAKNSSEPYVFIIDEINRGNISKIFGELITLIEDTKRAGAEEAMEAILPYSGDLFSVPQNVYILGTMNTADRSIALMDTALRRRFEFEEMMPDSGVLKRLGVDTIEVDGEELNVAKMLDVINERIEYLFDREHTIGHAFFTKLADDPSIETLASIFEKKVIPLLQEYFYEDYGKIQLVLGDNAKEDEFKFVLDNPLKIKDIFNGNPDIDLPEKGYSIQHEAFYKLDSYKQIGKDL